MFAHKVEVTLVENGALTLTNLPFQAGDRVEVILLCKSPKSGQAETSLRGSVLFYDRPTDPVAEEDWEACK